MKNAIKELTFNKPKQIIRPAIWCFLDGFSSMLPALIVYAAINMLTSAFDNPKTINFSALWIISGILMLYGIFQFFIVLWAYKNKFFPTAKHIAEDRIEYVQKLRRLPLGFFARKETGELINNYDGDFMSIAQAMNGSLSELFSALLSCVLTGIFMFLYNSALALAFYISIPVAAVLVALSMKILDKNSVRVAKAKDMAATNLNEYLKGMRTLKSYNQTGEGFQVLKNSYHELMSAHIKSESGGGSLLRLCTSIVQFGLPLLCITGGYLLIEGNLTIVNFIAIIVIGSKILSPITMSVANLMILRGNFTSGKRLDATMSQKEMTGKKTLEGDGDIRFENVEFSYSEGTEPALTNTSFTIKKGALTAIVGPSGSGKSTILRLIARFWDVSEGQILCGDTKLTEVDPEHWQQNISMVMQDVYLFHDTIRENIMFGRRDATEEEMIRASKEAGCYDFITALPDGYDTIIGEGGSTLSGGEKQRISIARAILKKAPILLLDEPTASLDAKNEVLVQNAVNELVKNTTVIMIAHRLKTVQNADNIIVLDKGKVSEQGRHAELLQKNGLYTKLWNMQAKSIDFTINKI